ncbi:hypothetical protein SDC9_130054 [bioreactor metagenome]|uniref:Uncharacterized protein n=1 Tax=bioreactor metagenome TaxID=1076179 RepID=A0A645D1I5_9ZZZZ
MNLASASRQLFRSGCVLAIAAVASFMPTGSRAAEQNLEIPVTEAFSTQARLAAYQWNFLKAEKADGQELPEIRQPDDWPRTLGMGFSEEGHGGIRVCNSIGWSYTLTGDDTIRFEKFYSTLMGCGTTGGQMQEGGNDVMGLEKRVTAKLPTARSFTLTGSPGPTPPLLTLTFADGSRWKFSGTPTIRTRYGDDTERAVIEVDAMRQLCAGEDATTQRECIRVREVRWDTPNRSDPTANARSRELTFGIEEMFKGGFHWRHVDDYSSAGPWQVLALDGIDGFKHTPGSHTLEYVMKYHLRNQPLGAPDFAYVHLGRMAPRAAP